MRARIGLAGAALLGAVLRFHPIWFALPYAQARPDETTAMGLAASVLAGDPNPHFFNWPSLTIYFFAGLFAAVTKIRGALAPDDYFLIARAGVALAGTATILVLARLARRAAGTRTALLAALFLAVAVLHVRDSHFATVDVLMTMWVTGCLALVLEAMDDPSPRMFALAGLVGGLAMSTKYSAAPLALTVFFARPGKRPRPRDVAIFGAAFAAGFLAGTPFSLAEPALFLRDVRYESTHLVGGHGTIEPGRGWRYHLLRTLPYGLGMPLFAAAVAGIWPLWRNHRRAAIPIGVFALAYYAAMGVGHTVFFRYTMALVPILCLSAAIFVRWSSDWLAPQLRLSTGVVAAILAVIVAGPSLLRDLEIDRLLARTDSRQLATDWLVPRLQPDDTLYDHGDLTGLALGRAQFHGWVYDAASGTFPRADGRTPDWLVLYDSPLTLYTRPDGNLEALARSNYTLEQEFKGVGAATDGIFDPQDAFFLPIARFDGVERPGPDVRIYRLNER